LKQRLANALQNTLDVVYHFIVPEAHNSVAQRFKELSPRRVSRNRVGVLRSINLNDQHRVETNEVNNVLADRTLPAKAKILDLLIANPMPEFSFDVSGAPAQFPGGGDYGAHPHPDLPPLGGGRRRLACSITHFTSLPPLTRYPRVLISPSSPPCA